MGKVLLDAERPDEAARVLRKALDAMEPVLHPSDGFLLHTRLFLAEALVESDPEESERLLRQERAYLREHFKKTMIHLDTLTLLLHVVSKRKGDVSKRSDAMRPWPTPSKA